VEQQLPARALPQVKQYWSAQSTQVWSQVVSQQRGSMPHTVSQQTGSEQFGFSCGTRQLPVAGSPHSSRAQLRCTP
jgi:hypothetical protein